MSEMVKRLIHPLLRMIAAEGEASIGTPDGQVHRIAWTEDTIEVTVTIEDLDTERRNAVENAGTVRVDPDDAPLDPYEKLLQDQLHHAEALTRHAEALTRLAEEGIRIYSAGRDPEQQLQELSDAVLRDCSDERLNDLILGLDNIIVGAREDGSPDLAGEARRIRRKYQDERERRIEQA